MKINDSLLSIYFITIYRYYSLTGACVKREAGEETTHFDFDRVYRYHNRRQTVLPLMENFGGFLLLCVCMYRFSLTHPYIAGSAHATNDTLPIIIIGVNLNESLG